MTRMSGGDLMKYLKHQMNPTTYYQPLIISELIKSGGVASQRDLAEALMLGDEAEVKRWEQDVLGRWPKRTLLKHGVVSYDRRARSYQLLADIDDDVLRTELLDECAVQVRKWQRQLSHKSSSKRYEALSKAAGCCQLCGAPGQITPLHVDHIFPKTLRNKKTNTVTMSAGEVVDVDDDRNLQVLCETCNTGKKASDDTDFRPSIARLAEVIHQVRRLAAELDISVDELETLAQQVDGLDVAASIKETSHTK